MNMFFLQFAFGDFKTWLLRRYTHGSFDRRKLGKLCFRRYTHYLFVFVTMAYLGMGSLGTGSVSSAASYIDISGYVDTAPYRSLYISYVAKPTQNP